MLMANPSPAPGRESTQQLTTAEINEAAGVDPAALVQDAELATAGVEVHPVMPAAVEPPVPGSEAADQGLNLTPSAKAGPDDKPVGLDAEAPIWSARYSLKNFIGRAVFRGLLTIAWITLAGYTWGTGHGYEQLPMITWIAGGVVLLLWLHLGIQIFRARMSHLYELTTKRLFVSTGIWRRRRDQVELLRIDDVYIKQPSLFHRMFDVGTVVVESSEDKLPVSYLSGVDDPHRVMDIIWHCARAERDHGSVKIDEL